MAEEKRDNYLETVIEANKTLQSELSTAREEMAKMAEDNQTMIRHILEGNDQRVDEPVDIQALREELYTENRKKRITNLDYVSKTLKLRKAIMDKGGNDPFMGFGTKYAGNPEQEAIQAQRVADCLQACVDEANGDPLVFNAKFQGSLKPTALEAKFAALEPKSNKN